ncbi:histidine decarboxylase [Streptomyces sp. NPDC056672]|uniref:histidine decarboxylase n=1 Tax=Streptomyces sp. NPDC056672 TaxID=3345906 RepID=UPI00369A2F42
MPHDALIPTLLSPLSDPSLRIGDQSSDSAADTRHVLDLVASVRAEQPSVLGFPGNLALDFAQLGPALNVFFNNIGDPDSDGSVALNTKAFERAVIAYFAETAGTSPADVYGYLTTGGSEGILYGLLTARRHLPHACVYASDQAHYSVARAVETLGMRLVTVPSREDGTMDPDVLKAATLIMRRLNPRTGRGPGAIVLATIGTTMRGAYDDVTALRRTAGTAGDVYVHADAASGGLVAAHAPSKPRWSFAHGADSLSISGHKVIGLPMPCGVVLVRRDLAVAAAPGGEYTGAADRTLACSRNGLAALFMWASLRRLGHAGMRAHILRCLDTAAYAHERLAQAGADPARTADSLMVTFRRPPPPIAERWHLACEGDRAHIVTVGHVTRKAIDGLCHDLDDA